jgi:hypothetical protein
MLGSGSAGRQGFSKDYTDQNLLRIKKFSRGDLASLFPNDVGFRAGGVVDGPAP